MKLTIVVASTVAFALAANVHAASFKTLLCGNTIVGGDLNSSQWRLQVCEVDPLPNIPNHPPKKHEFINIYKCLVHFSGYERGKGFSTGIAARLTDSTVRLSGEDQFNNEYSLSIDLSRTIESEFGGIIFPAKGVGKFRSVINGDCDACRTIIDVSEMDRCVDVTEF